MSVCIVSGGTATNSLVQALDEVPAVRHVVFVMPVSDNGGSSAEILRVFKGPAIGDIRSRITRLIQLKASAGDRVCEQLAKFLGYRLNSWDRESASQEWHDIVSGQHVICSVMDSVALRDYLRFMLLFLDTRIRDFNAKMHKKDHYFNFQNASVGNLFLVAIRLFYDMDLAQSTDFFVRLAGVDAKYEILPSINSKLERFGIAVELANGEVIRGQSQISHPSPAGQKKPNQGDLDLSATESPLQLIFDKKHIAPLPARIQKLYYYTRDGAELWPELYGAARDRFAGCDVVLYSIGSLVTSIMPVLVLRGTAAAIVGNKRSKKVFALNGNNDRETMGMDCVDYVLQVVNSMLRSLGKASAWDAASGSGSGRDDSINDDKKNDINNDYNTNDGSNGGSSAASRLTRFQAAYLAPHGLALTSFVTHVVYLDECSIDVDVAQLRAAGIACVPVKTVAEKLEHDLLSRVLATRHGTPETSYRYDLDDFKARFREILESESESELEAGSSGL